MAKPLKQQRDREHPFATPPKAVNAGNRYSRYKI
jgi:hypothetical protein